MAIFTLYFILTITLFSSFEIAWERIAVKDTHLVKHLDSPYIKDADGLLHSRILRSLHPSFYSVNLGIFRCFNFVLIPMSNK